MRKDCNTCSKLKDYSYSVEEYYCSYRKVVITEPTLCKGYECVIDKERGKI